MAGARLRSAMFVIDQPATRSHDRSGLTAHCLAQPRLIAVIAWLCALPAGGGAETNPGTNRASASIDFRVIIPVVVRATSVRPQESLVVEARHIAEGFIDVAVEDSLLLTSNSRRGYQLTARHDESLLSGVDIELSGQQLVVRGGVGNMRVVAERSNNQPVPIRYRLHLAAGVTPGRYRWPVALQFSNPLP